MRAKAVEVDGTLCRRAVDGACVAGQMSNTPVAAKARAPRRIQGDGGGGVVAVRTLKVRTKNAPLTCAIAVGGRHKRRPKRQEQQQQQQQRVDTAHAANNNVITRYFGHDSPPSRLSPPPPSSLTMALSELATTPRCRPAGAAPVSPPAAATAAARCNSATTAAAAAGVVVSPHRMHAPSIECALLPPPPAPPVTVRQCGRDVSSAPIVAPSAGTDRPARSRQLLTDYFPIRRSCRRTKQQRDAERDAAMWRRLAAGDDTAALQVRVFAERGRGVVAVRRFERGEFVLEYAGQLVDGDEARRREALYSGDSATGCYMYYFRWRGRCWCVDATGESGRLGRLVNHSRAGANLCTRTVQYDTGSGAGGGGDDCQDGGEAEKARSECRPRLVLVARRDIEPGEELLYDYGDRSKESLAHHPWLAA